MNMDTEDIFSFDSIRKDEQASSSGRAGDAASAVAGQGMGSVSSERTSLDLQQAHLVHLAHLAPLDT